MTKLACWGKKIVRLIHPRPPGVSGVRGSQRRKLQSSTWEAVLAQTMIKVRMTFGNVPKMVTGQARQQDTATQEEENEGSLCSDIIVFPNPANSAGSREKGAPVGRDRERGKSQVFSWLCQRERSQLSKPGRGKTMENHGGLMIFCLLSVP